MRRLGIVLGLLLAMQVGPAMAAGPWMVFFERGKDEVTPRAAQLLRLVAENYQKAPQGQVMVGGHTSRLGADSANVALSQRRAAKVRDFLVAFGIPDGVITTEAFGESRPLVETLDGVAEPQNDRAEITIGPGSGW